MSPGDGGPSEEPVWIEHAETCPVSQPGFRLPTLPDGTVDMNAPQRCNCDFMQRLKEFLEL